MFAVKDFYHDIASKYNIKTREISVAEDCSGISSVLMALKLLNIKYKHEFSSEIDKDCIDFIHRNYKPNKLYLDLKNRDNNRYKNKPLDLFVGGFPCQAFSTLGKGLGFMDDIKGTIFFHVYDFLCVNKPNIFILENVRSLKTHDKGQTFATIMYYLNKLSVYNVYYDILNTKDFGIPQSRNRIFIIGIKKTIQKKPFKFPNKINLLLPLNIFIGVPSDENQNDQNEHDRKEYDQSNPLSERNLSLLSDVVEAYPQENFFSTETPWVLNFNIGTKAWFRRGEQGLCPCLVTTPRFIIPSQLRFLNAHECLMLQGIPVFDQAYDFDFNDKQLYKFAGNSISTNVLMFILGEIFKCVKL